MENTPVNLCGFNLPRLRQRHRPPLTQESLAAKIQTLGLDIDRGTIAKIETQKRRVYDFELVVIAEALRVPASKLLSNE